ncbi:MAG TPA: carboxylating nicotinate-nucleotide diphosphorylase [candidate division Zixibacteria bacterium]|nr:carboxylating nicotinate-nucleotide diphosphorylase [candidate division Zixibacteria bacterium]
MEQSHFECLRKIVEAALKEDVNKGDLTSLACLEPNPMKANIVAKSDGILSGVKPVLLTFDIVDSANVVRPLKSDSEPFSKGDVIFELEGFNQTLLTAERTALNFLGHLSGIATLTGKFVEQVKGTRCRILDTRKTAPGLRMLEKAAVVDGGGSNHRFGLYDMVLIKDNHIASAGSIAEAVKRTREFLTTPEFRLQFDAKAEDIQIEVEVASESQLREAIESGITRILLDNQSTEGLAQLVSVARKLNDAVELEASGNVSLDSVGRVAATGVDYISIGALTHSAISSDFSMKAVE